VRNATQSFSAGFLRVPEGGDRTPRRGCTVSAEGARFAVFSQAAEQIWLCLFDPSGDTETARIEMQREGDDFTVFVPGLKTGARYGLRADGAFDPVAGQWFDPAKLLMDPYATRIDRPWKHDERLALPRSAGFDTARLVPKAIVEARLGRTAHKAAFEPGGLIYEINVRGFSMRHPDIPQADRGTLRALCHPAVIAHLKRIGVSAVELMPITAWIDERHLPGLGLSNAWGYNPVTFMAVDQRLAPGGIADLRSACDALRSEDIGVILDLVFNHTGESDRLGPTLSLRGLDNRAYYRHDPADPGLLINDTGCGNTVACERPHVRELILASLHHFVAEGGVDGFRFDLAPILGRTALGFDPQAETLAAIALDPVLADRVLIAEPWDIGPGGYQLGRFGNRFLEWNDRYRDGVRRFWRGDGTAAELATRLAGSFDVFAGERTRSVSFVAAHDGFTLIDLVSHAHKHNEANGEENRDGHDENFSWNHGVEGETDDQSVQAARKASIKAMLSTLFATRGTIMLAAGDEFGRTQHGNNNAYAQDNEMVWLDWGCRDREIEEHVAGLAELRRCFAVLRSDRRLTGELGAGGIADVEWLGTDGRPLEPADWENQQLDCFAMVLATGDPATPRIAILFNRASTPANFRLEHFPGGMWSADEMMVASRNIGTVIENL
jgi:glycogen debranching enzyme